MALAEHIVGDAELVVTFGQPEDVSLLFAILVSHGTSPGTLLA